MATSPAIGLRARLGRTFLLQAMLVGVAALLGVLVASAVLEGVLIREALQGEATHFWKQRDRHADFPLPDTHNLRGYLQDVPPELRPLAPGYHPWKSNGVDYLVYVNEHAGQRLYLAFDRSSVGRLAVWFGIVPLAIAFVVLYLTTWLGLRASRRAFSPVIALARSVRELDPQSPDASAFDPERLPANADDEIRELSAALARFAQRLNEFVDRERHFTRDASHELRSPLTVIRMAADLLAEDPRIAETSQRSVNRIRRAAREMEELTEAFLLLARESESGLPVEEVCINDVVTNELERLRPIADGKGLELKMDARARVLLQAPEKVLAVLLGNLLRNAVAYTERGHVSVAIAAGEVTIEDTGVGIAPDRVRDMYKPFVRGNTHQAGYGVGLTIVRRLSDRFGWPVAIESEPGVGTKVRVGFPTATVRA